MAKAKEEKDGEEEEPEYTEFVRSSEEEKVQLDLKLGQMSGKKKELLPPVAGPSSPSPFLFFFSLGTLNTDDVDDGPATGGISSFYLPDICPSFRSS